jgi:hypothetical protein
VRPCVEALARVRFRMPVRPLSLFASLFVLPLAVATLTGCGTTSKTNGVAAKQPSEALAAAKAAADAASSVHVSGSAVSAGSPITLDLDLVAGEGGRGEVSEDGLSLELIHVGDTVYIKGSPAFYQRVGGPAAAQLLQGRWLKAPATVGSFASLASLTDLRQLVDTTLAIRGTPARAGSATIGGQKAIGITNAARGGTLYIATTGPPYPVAASEDAAGGGRIVLDRWNGPVSLAAPTNAIDITQLQSSQ